MINDKHQLRKWAKDNRKLLNIEELSLIFVQKILETNEYKSAKNIMIYYPLKYEINLLKLLEDKTKIFFLPKIEGENLLCCSYKDGEELCESCFKTKEPLSEPSNKSILDLIIVPALAVDKDNYRLGYGGGFYDRFLKGVNSTKITCLPKKFVLDTVYPEDHDIKLDKIITA